jgi:hypothetical protein
MVDVTIDLLKAQLRQLRLPTMGQESRVREAGARRCRVQPDLRRVLAPVDQGRTGDPCRQRGRHPDQERGVPGAHSVPLPDLSRFDQLMGDRGNENDCNN